YVYGVLHSPQYRECYTENPKRELPQIPLTPALSQREREPDLPSPAGRGAGGEGKSFGAEGTAGGMQKPPPPPALLQRCPPRRRGATNAEQLLGQLLRDRQLAGAKFRRQHPLRGYILDFYCHDARLAIELDGSGHAKPPQAAYDAERTRALQAE